MVRTENHCVDCGLPCLGSSCPNRNVRVLRCDQCEEETDKLYKLEGEELCEECLFEALEVIE